MKRGRVKNPTAYEWRKTRKQIRETHAEADEARRARDGEIERLRRECRQDAKAIKTDCAKKRKRARAAANRAIKSADDDRRAIRRAHHAGTRVVLRSEHDDLTEQNIAPEYIPLWREYAHTFKWRGVSPDHRAEQFGEWLEEHPEAMDELWDEIAPTDRDYERAAAAHYREEAVPF